MKTCPSCGKLHSNGTNGCPVEERAPVASPPQPDRGTESRSRAAEAPTEPPLLLGSPPPQDAARDRGAVRDADPAERTTDRDNASSLLAGRYRLGRRLGAGGFGTVYDAEDLRLHKRVAVKVLSPRVAGDREALERFRLEAIAASRVRCEHIVDVTDFDRDRDGTSFLVMEHLDGEDLAALLAREGPLPPERTLAIAEQIATALAAAHDCGIIHRDLKPSNLFLARRASGEDFIKVLDFGISKVARPPAGVDRALTATGQAVGTPYYMAPEQARGARDVDERADVYAVGCILYEMLTQRPPFVGDSYLDVLSKHASETPAPPSTYAAALDPLPQTDELVLRALAKEPRDRFESMASLAEAIASCRADCRAHDDDRALADTATATARPSASTKRSARRRLALATGGIALLAAAVTVVVLSTTRSGSGGAAAPTRATTSQASVAVSAESDRRTPPSAHASRALPEKVTVRISSSPSPAIVFYQGRAVGSTPYEAEIPRPREPVTYVLRRKGYVEGRVTFAPEERRRYRRYVILYQNPRVAHADPKSKANRKVKRVHFVTDEMEINGEGLFVRFSVWNNTREPILVSRFSLHEYRTWKLCELREPGPAFDTITRSKLTLGYTAKNVDKTFRLEPGDVGPFTAEVRLDRDRECTASAFAVDFYYSTAAGERRQSTSDAMFFVARDRYDFFRREHLKSITDAEDAESLGHELPRDEREELAKWARKAYAEHAAR